MPTSPARLASTRRPGRLRARPAPGRRRRPDAIRAGRATVIEASREPVTSGAWTRSATSHDRSTPCTTTAADRGRLGGRRCVDRPDRLAARMVRRRARGTRVGRRSLSPSLSPWACRDWYLASPIWIRTSLVEAGPAAAPGRHARRRRSPHRHRRPSPTSVATARPHARAPRRSRRRRSRPARSRHRRVPLRTRDRVDRRGEPGRFHLRLEDFSVRNGPDLFVYLSPARTTTLERRPRGGPAQGDRRRVRLRPAAGTDPSRFRSAIIWCKQFSHLFAVAPLGPTASRKSGLYKHGSSAVPSRWQTPRKRPWPERSSTQLGLLSRLTRETRWDRAGYREEFRFRVQRQEPDLRGLWTGIRVHRVRAGLLCAAWLHRAAPLRLVPGQPQGRPQRGRRRRQLVRQLRRRRRLLRRRWRWRRRWRVRWWRWLPRPRPARDVRGHLLELWPRGAGSHSARPAASPSIAATASGACAAPSPILSARADHGPPNQRDPRPGSSADPGRSIPERGHGAPPTSIAAWIGLMLPIGKELLRGPIGGVFKDMARRSARLGLRRPPPVPPRRPRRPTDHEADDPAAVAAHRARDRTAACASFRNPAHRQDGDTRRGEPRRSSAWRWHHRSSSSATSSTTGSPVRGGIEHHRRAADRPRRSRAWQPPRPPSSRPPRRGPRSIQARAAMLDLVSPRRCWNRRGTA